MVWTSPDTPTAFELNLDRFLQEELTLAQPIISLLHRMLSLVTTSYTNSGKLSRAPRISQISLLKNALFFGTFKKPTHVLNLAVSWEGITLVDWEQITLDS